MKNHFRDWLSFYISFVIGTFLGTVIGMLMFKATTEKQNRVWPGEAVERVTNFQWQSKSRLMSPTNDPPHLRKTEERIQ